MIQLWVHIIIPLLGTLLAVASADFDSAGTHRVPCLATESLNRWSSRADHTPEFTAGLGFWGDADVREESETREMVASSMFEAKGMLTRTKERKERNKAINGGKLRFGLRTAEPVRKLLNGSSKGAVFLRPTVLPMEVSRPSIHHMGRVYLAHATTSSHPHRSGGRSGYSH